MAQTDISMAGANMNAALGPDNLIIFSDREVHIIREREGERERVLVAAISHIFVIYAPRPREVVCHR